MKHHQVYKSLVTMVTFTRSDAADIQDGVVRATWEGELQGVGGGKKGWGIVRAAG